MTSAKDEDKIEKMLREVVAEDPIASYVRSYCVRRFSRDTIMKCLYSTGQERHIEFDLGGLRNENISEEYLHQLSTHLRFESILKYVVLPKLTIEAPPRKKRASKNSPRHKRGRSDLVTVFKWLRDNHVQKIVKVILLDDRDPCHADSSIEEALKGFDVEIWDWKRVDLSSEVISNSTDAVKEVSVYCSGNNAVLMGWASPQGFPHQEKFPHAYEDSRRLEDYITTFKATIKSLSDGRITVGHILDNRDSPPTRILSSSGSLIMNSENPWIDGADASRISLDGKITVGKSFSPYANSNDLMSPYFTSSSNHGTCMAMLICRLCPMVQLSVARLDQRQTMGSNQRHITSKSAAEAIQWATDCGVDIISMSWTIETPVPGNAAMKSLEAAVKAAEKKKILMLCSTSDQGSLTKDYCYPGDFDACVKVGSASNTGDAMSWVNIEKVDFLLPGTDVPFSINGGKTVSHESGSSVATAAASGLAGVLIIASWLLDENDMTLAFKNLSPDNKYPRVYERLEKRFKEALARAEDAEPGRLARSMTLRS
ncbi:peptidase S8/S53 domain-containing protein [Thelonectria olida]|uniref:Peptidase S8/S53 domain-containing protein n=1 Tax=Thelonectria olida TaxID=1576542 RepID=A0A9P9AJW8_9HYPO|nr:peptidase S8/S53 domain-containing protein [Thelonectria olida]